VTTDIHEPYQAAVVGEVADLVQLPAFLCRQTDLLCAAASTGKPVNLKKGPFLAPWDAGHALAKLMGAGAVGAMVTERGTSFGYNRLVVDMQSLPQLRQLGVPVCFDATHATQQPGGQGDQSGGSRDMVPCLARAAAGVGIDVLFLEVHPDPANALSDGASMVPLGQLGGLLRQVLAIDRALRELP
jgi:2-dehydro-3-deoxyphosphooctonate aldolase (KDO 8-P synthase)